MSLGKKIRMHRLLNKVSGNMLVIALDHAIGWGVLPGIENMQKILEEVIEAEPDAVTMLKGSAVNNFLPYAGKIPLIMKATTFSPYHPAYDAQIGYVEEAIALGADAIAVGITIGGDKQIELLVQAAKIIREANKYGLPVISHIYPKGELIEKSVRYHAENVAYAARAAAEIGVDIIKTYYTGDPGSYAKVIEAATPVIVVVSGGPKLTDLKKLFQMTRDAIDTGARGVTYGRNVWQSKYPKIVIKALKHIIHNKGTVNEALDIVGVLK